MPITNDDSIVRKGILRSLYYKINKEVCYLLSKKVDKEDGKGLSTNDFDNDYKDKLDNLSNYSLPIANSSRLGGIKTGYTSTDKTYGVQVDADGDAYVRVPWTDTNTTYTVVSKNANGLTPMLPDDSTKFLNGKGEWVVPDSGGGDYELPKATSSRLGGVIIGNNISVTDGKISITNQNVVDALGKTPLTASDVINNNTSKDTDKPVSAYQVTLLNNKINDINEELKTVHKIYKGTSSTPPSNWEDGDIYVQYEV